MPSLNKNHFKTKNLPKTKNLFPPLSPPPAQAAAASKPPAPPRTPFAPWEPVHLPHPQPPPLKGRGRRGGLRTIERSTTTSKRARPPHSTPPTQTRNPPTRKGPGRKARPRASPYVTASPGRRASFSLLALRKVADRLVPAGSWPSSSFRGGSSGTLRVPSSPPYTRAAAKTPPQACRKAPRTAEHPRPGTRAQDAPERPPEWLLRDQGWRPHPDTPTHDKGPPGTYST